MSNEAENLEPDHVPLDAFDLLPETERRQRLLKQWTDGFAEDGSTIVVARSISENPLSFQLREVFPQLANRVGKLHRRWADCQLASDSVRWHLRLGRHLVCLIPAGRLWFAGLGTNVTLLVLGDGHRNPVSCLEELRETLADIVGIYAGRIAEARRHRPPAEAEPESEPAVTEPEPDTSEVLDEKPEDARDPPK